MDDSPLCRFGHLALTRDLELVGLSRRGIETLQSHPNVVRPRKGVYVCIHLDDAEQSAAEVGARLDCVTVLARHGIWVGNTRGLHLRMPPKAGAPAVRRLRSLQSRVATAGVRVLGSRQVTAHWMPAVPDEPGRRLEVPVVDALRAAMGCLPPDDLIAALESALHLKEITSSELDQLVIAAPRRLQTALAQLTPGAQSGYETTSRLGFQRRGHTVEIQFAVPGVGHLDEVIDGVVALEIDGRATHAESFEVDRDRDLGTELWGLRCLRIPAVWVDTRWDEVVDTVERMIRDAPSRA